MLLSIITINYNNLGGLIKTVESIINQKFKNFEYLVIDGGSNDGSVDFIKNQTDVISSWISEKDNGIYDAINKGIKHASGEYLMFLNSGDFLFDQDVLEFSFNEISKYPKKDIFYGDIYLKRKSEDKLALHQHPSALDISFFVHNNLNHQATFIRSKLFTDFGLYPMEYKLAADHWLYLKAIIEGKEFCHLDRPLVIYDGDGLSSKKRGEYDIEMREMWSKMVPKYVQNVVTNFNACKFNGNSKPIKAALWVNLQLNKLRKASNSVG